MDQLARPILLLTDLGLVNHYVGQVKRVLQSLVPRSAIIDISHGIDKYAVNEGAWVLEPALAAAPRDAVIMAVVGPGVGSNRKGIVVESGDRSFVGPDNGLLAAAFTEEERRNETLSASRVRELTNHEFHRAAVSSTFQRRDIFAPATAALARGVPASKLGPLLGGATVLHPFAGCTGADGLLTGEVVHVDSYGNLGNTATTLGVVWGASVMVRTR